MSDGKPIDIDLYDRAERLAAQERIESGKSFQGPHYLQETVMDLIAKDAGTSQWLQATGIPNEQ